MPPAPDIHHKSTGLHLNASLGLLWHHLPGLNSIHLPSLALPSPPVGLTDTAATGELLERNRTDERERCSCHHEGRCPKASQSLLWDGPPASYTLSTLRQWSQKSSVLSLPEHTNCSAIIGTAVVSPKIPYLWWESSSVMATVACSLCGDCSTGF